MAVRQHTALQQRGDGQFALVGTVGFDDVSPLLVSSRQVFTSAKITVDLAAVPTASSAALAVFLEWRRWQPRCTIQYCNVPTALQVLAQALCVQELFSCTIDEFSNIDFQS